MQNSLPLLCVCLSLSLILAFKLLSGLYRLIKAPEFRAPGRDSALHASRARLSIKIEGLAAAALTSLAKRRECARHCVEEDGSERLDECVPLTFLSRPGCIIRASRLLFSHALIPSVDGIFFVRLFLQCGFFFFELTGFYARRRQSKLAVMRELLNGYSNSHLNTHGKRVEFGISNNEFG